MVLDMVTPTRPPLPLGLVVMERREAGILCSGLYWLTVELLSRWAGGEEWGCRSCSHCNLSNTVLNRTGKFWHPCLVPGKIEIMTCGRCWCCFSLLTVWRIGERYYRVRLISLTVVRTLVFHGTFIFFTSQCEEKVFSPRIGQKLPSHHVREWNITVVEILLLTVSTVLKDIELNRTRTDAKAEIPIL